MKMETWSQEFDTEYGKLPIEQWAVGLVASALTHEKTQPMTDASHITEKLIEKFSSQRREALEELQRRIDEKIKYDMSGTYDSISSIINEMLDGDEKAASDL